MTEHIEEHSSVSFMLTNVSVKLNIMLRLQESSEWVLHIHTCGRSHHLSADGTADSTQPCSIPPVGYDAGPYTGQEYSTKISHVRTCKQDLAQKTWGECVWYSHHRTGDHSLFPRAEQPAVNTLDRTCLCSTAVWCLPEHSHPDKQADDADLSSHHCYKTSKLKLI